MYLIRMISKRLCLLGIVIMITMFVSFRLSPFSEERILFSFKSYRDKPNQNNLEVKTLGQEEKEKEIAKLSAQRRKGPFIRKGREEINELLTEEHTKRRIEKNDVNEENNTTPDEHKHDMANLKTTRPVRKENFKDENGELREDNRKLRELNEENRKVPKENGMLAEEIGKPAEHEPKEHKLIKLPVPKLIYGTNGQGRNGEAVKIDRDTLDPASKILYDEGYKRNDFNEYLSNIISVDRLIPDSRDPLCHDIKYPDDLPDTSVIITFLNEAWSVLVRTIHSIIRTAPSHLLREIILVDDFSDYEYLLGPLENYMQRFPKVKILRNFKREGLIRSRLNGAKVAKGQVLTFLDSHIECVNDWLPPLLTRIREDPSHVVWPSIPPINQKMFHLPAHISAANMSVGTFTWGLRFTWKKPNLSDRESPVSPIRSPTMAGGLFSIDREYFYHIGSYDDQMLFWGGENLEMSFRIWMCGGTIEVIPCSIIGHIYRMRNVNDNPKITDNIHRNLKRTAVVWMDEYSHLYTKVTNRKLENYGDVSARVALRKQLNCKSFEWYLNNLCVSYYGALQSVADTSLCLHAEDRASARVMTDKCNLLNDSRQVFYMTDQEELRHLTTCMDANTATLTMYDCHRRKGTQQFQFRDDGTVYNRRLKLCMEANLAGVTARLVTCDRQKKTQQWTWVPVAMNLLKT